MTTAIYPGTFDPVTNGHLDIATRAARLFDKVIIAVYDTPDKKLLFTIRERIQLARQSVVDLLNVEVQSYTGLTVDFAQLVGAETLVRGLRIGADFEGEFEMALMNKNLAPDCELVCLMASLKYQFLSSSLLKEVARLGGNIGDLVPKPVADALKEKLIISRKTVSARL
ncbi:MAG: pantetheine-phosphate adenylyltransferase [Dehalococcoidales bacterium]|nr:pantetheine-phosphate adenylyltransferase [Dehalococcoidales bacterium]MDP6221998.1 pantetheine-phosphate adenylyltransferase [Dehalococcoidales bacterium]MDP7109783.1 pantetheine-phosphate adenylyltransferase [Dehalococcoidales bacterium]MDP7310249.1 pantetheine-phosphate adenylyltransferase [Dehalococcoidales bacterium]MDP7409241.1 pantetheine-phosphate adenylyltransferase [Dehalococcoidales bacterium]